MSTPANPPIQPDPNNPSPVKPKEQPTPAIETRSLESRMAIALDHAHLFLCMVQLKFPTYFPEYMTKLKHEVGVLVDSAEVEGLLPEDEPA